MTVPTPSTLVETPIAFAAAPIVVSLVIMHMTAQIRISSGLTVQTLPVALALGALLLVLLAVTAILVSLRKPVRVRAPDWVHGRESEAAQGDDGERMVRLGCRRIEPTAGLSEPPDGRR